MAANIVFVDEGTVGEVVGGEDSDFDENTDNYESSEDEGVIGIVVSLKFPLM